MDVKELRHQAAIAAPSGGPGGSEAQSRPGTVRDSQPKAAAAAERGGIGVTFCSINRETN